MFTRLISRVFFILLCLNESTSGQPSVCQNPPSMTSYCADACIICDIDGFTGRNNSSITGQAPPGFCTSFVHHMQWIGFIAGSQDLRIEVTVSNCVRNNGLEIGLYESLNCVTFRRVSECDTDVRPGQTRLFVNTVPLTVGQYYYFVMDGSGDDICDYSVRVISGSTRVAPLDTSPVLDFPDQSCQNELIEFNTPGLPGATFYNWIVNSQLVESGQTIRYRPESSGTYEICLDAFNVCSRAPRSCKKIEVLPTPKTTIQQQLCNGACFTFFGTKYCDTGVYNTVLKASNGCDSIISLQLIIDERIMSTDTLHICDGDTLHIGDKSFTSEGTHQTLIRTQEGCIIDLTIYLKVIQCNIQSSSIVENVQCNGDESGAIVLTVENGTGPFEYKCIKVENPSVNFQGVITDVGESTVISGVGEGHYQIFVNDEFGNSHVNNIFVNQPAAIGINILTSDYNGYEVSCSGIEDGSISAEVAGGTPPYSIYFPDLDIYDNMVEGLNEGQYLIEITDANGCIQSNTVRLIAPETLKPDIQISNPDCTEENSGIIQIREMTGGVAPYRYSLNNSVFSEEYLFKNLSSGSYVINISDRNGCITVDTIILIGAVIPEIYAGQDSFDIKLGETVQLSIEIQPEDATVAWSPAEHLSCHDCRVTTSLPLTTSLFVAEVTSADGCTRAKQFIVNVQKIRSFILSDIFSPNGDNLNDRLTYFADNDVALIQDFRIYDRWGNAIFMIDQLTPGHKEIPWEAVYNGKKVESGTYTYSVKVIYIDQESIQYKGSLTLLK